MGGDTTAHAQWTAQYGRNRDAKTFFFLLKKINLFTLNGTDRRFHPITSKHIFYFLVMMKGKRKSLLQVYPQKKPVWVWPDFHSAVMVCHWSDMLVRRRVLHQLEAPISHRLAVMQLKQTDVTATKFSPEKFQVIFFFSNVFNTRPHPASGRVKNIFLQSHQSDCHI